MSLKVGNCTVAYLRLLITDPIIDKPIILQLAAKIGNVLQLSWLKPRIEHLEGTKAAKNGLRLKGNLLLLNGYVVPMKGVSHTIHHLYRLMEVQKPIFLVTYSTQREMKLFYEAIRKTHRVENFGRLIEGVINTLPIFQERYPDLYRKGEVDLPIIAQHALGRDCSTGYFDTSRHFELLEELVSGSKLRFEFNKYSQFWGEISSDKSASKNPLIKAPIRDLSTEIIEANEEIEAWPNEDDPIEKKPTVGLDPESSGSLVGGQIPVQQFRDRKNLYKQLLINQDRLLNTSDSFAAQRQEIPHKIRRRNNYVAFAREPEDLNPETGSFVEEQGPQFPDWQNSDDQLLTNQDQSVNYDRFSALGEKIPEGIHQFIAEYEARRDNDYPFQQQPEDPNAGIRPFVDEGASFRPLSYPPNPVNLPPVNQNQRGRDWICDWSQEYNDFSGENGPFFL